MLKLTIFLLSCVLLDNALGLKCWTCTESKDNWECYAKGSLQTCDVNEGSCQNEIRVDKQYDTVNFRRVVVGSLIRVKKGCKQTAACTNNQDQNDKTQYKTMTWSKGQCDFSPLNTVCRCCCQTDECNLLPLHCRPNTLDRSISYSFNRPDDQGAAPFRHPCDERSNPCGNGGKCLKVGTGFKYSCRCPWNWMGDDHCNTPTDHHNNQLPTAEQVAMLEEQQKRAQFAEAMQQVCLDFNPCGNGGFCNRRDNNGRYECQCLPGWGDLHCNTRVYN